MENQKDVFFFSAQQIHKRDVGEGSGSNPGIGGSAKRARAESDTPELNNADVETPRKEVTGSFKSKLMSMSCPSSWTDCEANRGKLNIEQDDILVSNGPSGPMMKLSPKLKDQLHKPWANALILKNMGRFHTLGFMTTKLTQKWNLVGQWHLTDLGEGYFVVRFQLKEDLEYVLTNGPWVIMNQYLAVQRWKPNFVPGEDSIQSMPIWVDPITENQARGRFARICVEIDITKPLLGSLSIEDRSIRVEYESLGLICFKCGRFGHCKESYRDGIVETVQEEVMCDNQIGTDKEASPFGPWLLVSYGKQGYRNTKGKMGKTSYGSTNYMARNGSVKNGPEGSARNGADGNARRMEGEFSEVRYGKKNYVKNGAANTVGNRTSGSRFDVLSEETEETMNKSSNHLQTKSTRNKNKEKCVMSDITNLSRNQILKQGKRSKKVFKKADKIGFKKIGTQGDNCYFKKAMGTKNISQEHQSPCLVDDSEDQDNVNELRHLHNEIQEVDNKNCKIADEDCLLQDDVYKSAMQTDMNFDTVASALGEAMAVISE
ncbi:hypothetical protein LWI29_028212 [Acer saccharum]|uniref:DUF4283 domain-containing protein n=1 Tax=Acer saccharum TaxID=4024 RepID=A0AA39TSS0_ACESA|nr:hypothetical protein LWI29_028212 [Acer saccharum]